MRLLRLAAPMLCVPLACFTDPGGPNGDDEVGDGDGDGDGDGEGDGDGDGEGESAEGEGESDGNDSCPPNFSCAAPIPNGWTGPVVRASAGDPGDLPQCRGNYATLTTDGATGLNAPPASCSECSCGGPQGVECAPPTVYLYGEPNDTCWSDADLTFELLGHDVCKTFGSFADGDDSAKSDAVLPMAGTGSCPASGGEPTFSPAEWDAHLRVCEGAGLGDACGEGTCVPSPVTPFPGGLCIHREGERECPSEQYPARTIIYTGLDDERGCSECSCDSPTGAECEAQIELHYNDSCTNLGFTIANPGVQCVDMSGNGSGYAPRSGKLIVGDVVGGSCDSSGGTPSGEAVPTGAITLCCTE